MVGNTTPSRTQNRLLPSSLFPLPPSQPPSRSSLRFCGCWPTTPIQPIYITLTVLIILQTTTTMNRPRAPTSDSWFAPLSVDLLLKVLNITLLHPFVAWIIPLCFRAEHQAWDTRPMVVSIAWATFVTLLWMGNVLSHKIAYGMHREVDLNEEVIVITGGASGLGLLIAEVYGMRGATVAVLDTKPLESTEARGITYYQCDVADKAQIARVAAEIERDVSALSLVPCRP